ncbi:hypothetical protein [Pseudomonas sp. A2]|uniref:hypothetical protein n=1 Tax=Pseudomonas sp. A2 TaxID=107445 RepID=UPI001FFF1151|nr:hypothetical protein [Pseudomonas sp. A2]UPK87352.1 hypothetical protein E5221_21295 [Pseudomonas sp. A2]
MSFAEAFATPPAPTVGGLPLETFTGLIELYEESCAKILRGLERELVLMQLIALEERDQGGFTIH